MPVVSSPLSAYLPGCMPVAEPGGGFCPLVTCDCADMTVRFTMSHGVICASAPVLSLGIIREATHVKFPQCGARIRESQTHQPPIRAGRIN